MSSFDILPTPKKDEKIRLWGQENFRRIRDVITIINGTIAGNTEDVDNAQDAIADFETRLSVLEQSKAGNREIGYAAKTADQNGVGTTPTDLTGLTVQVKVGTKPIMVIGSVRYQKLTSAGYVAVQIYDTVAGIVQDIAKAVSTTNGHGATVIMVRLTPVAGNRTYKLRAFTENASANFLAAPSYPSFIQVIELDALEPADLDDFPIQFDTLDEIQAAFATLDEVQDYKV